MVGEDVYYPGKEEQSIPLALGGHVLQLDTTSFETIDYEQLFSQIQNILPAYTIL